MTWGRQVALAAMAAAVVATVVALPGVGVRAMYSAQTTADEPHYLLTAMSLVEDRDLDVADELAGQRWRPFHQAELPIQERRLDDGRQLAPHDPLLPILLMPGWALGGWVGAKVVLALLAGALAALLTWTAVRRFDVSIGVAVTTVIGVTAAWPLSGYATQVYPELPAALVTTAVVAVGTARRPPGMRRVLGLAALIAALPWLAVKYVPVAAALTAVLAWQWWRDGQRRALFRVLVLLGVAGVTYLGLHRFWYGGWTVYAAGDTFARRGEFSVIGFNPDLAGRARRLIGLLVGRDFGVAAWQPLWLLAVPALAVLGRRRPMGTAWIAAPLAVGWLNATFVALTMQGYWVPGRQIVIVLPLAALALAWWLDRAGPGWRTAAAVLGMAGIAAFGWLTVEGLAGHLTWVVDFAGVGDPLSELRSALLPDYLHVTVGTWIRQGAWLVLLALTAWQALRQDDRCHPVTVNGVTIPSA